MKWPKCKNLLALSLLALGLTNLSCESTRESMQPGQVRIVLSEVNSIDIESHTATFTLVKDQEDWKLKHEKQLLPAENESVENLLQLLNTIDLSVAVSNNKEEWSQYLVDSSGTRITVKTPYQTSLDIMIGKFGMESAEVYHTYVRLIEEKDVYEASQFMGIKIGRVPEIFRNKILARVSRKQLNSITFNYPEEGSFDLIKTNDAWLSDDKVMDPKKIEDYLSNIQVVIGTDFYNDIIDQSQPKSSITIRTLKNDSITINSYLLANGSRVFSSSINEGNYFSDQRIADLFKTKEDFLP